MTAQRILNALIILAAVVLSLPFFLIEKIRSRMKPAMGDDEKARGRGETFADEKSPPPEPVAAFACPPELAIMMEKMEAEE